MTELAVDATGLTKTYGHLTAVDHVDVKIARGSVFGLLGPNGAGKTTIIKLLTAISDLTSGEAMVAGFDVRRDPMKVKARIGWVAAEVILDDEFSGLENLWLQAKLQSIPEWKGKAHDLLRYFDLEGRAGDRVSTYSTGLRKKLEVALALLNEPRVIFMDEPTIGLDPGTRRMLWDLIDGVHREFGVSVLLTTHYIEEADRLCDRVAILDRGRIVAEGTPDELKSRVKADFIELEVAGELPDAALQGIPGVLEVKTEGRSKVLRVQSAEAALPRILGVVGPERLRRINVDTPSLETAFLEATGHRIEEENGTHDFRKFYMTIRRARQ